MFGICLHPFGRDCLLYIQIWQVDQLFPTLMWFFFTGLTLVFRVFTINENDNYFVSVFRDSWKIAIIFEFIVVLSAFSLLTELILQPAIFIWGMMVVIASEEVRYKKVTVLLEWLMVLFIVISLWHSLSNIWAKPESFLSSSTARNFIFPSLLAIGSIPFTYMAFCYSKVESANIQLRFQHFKNDELKTYAKRRVFLIFFFRPWLLKRAMRQLHLLPVNNRAYVNQIIKDILEYNRQEKNPSQIEPSRGWSPHTAVNMLVEHGLKTKDYHEIADEQEWWACSDPINLTDDFIASTVSFYISGDREVVKSLKLSGHFDDETNTEYAMELFGQIAISLFHKSFRLFDVDDCTIVVSKVDFSTELHGAHVNWKYDRWPSDKGFGVALTISRP